jgi:hypothetical protein
LKYVKTDVGRGVPACLGQGAADSIAVDRKESACPPRCIGVNRIVSGRLRRDAPD